MPRSGRSSLVALALLLLAGCWYGFAGGGLPAHVRTLAVLPFENETPSPELQREIWESLRHGLQSRLGLRDAPEARADAIVRGTIVRYETDVPVGFSADPTRVSATQRKLQIAVDVELVDQTTGKTLWQQKNLVAEAAYSERQEADGRKQAILQLVDKVVEGAQSQW